MPENSCAQTQNFPFDKASPTSTIRRPELWSNNNLTPQVGTTFGATEGGRNRSGRAKAEGVEGPSAARVPDAPRNEAQLSF